MRGIITRRIILFFSVFAAMMLLGAFVVSQVNAQNQNSNDIAKRFQNPNSFKICSWLRFPSALLPSSSFQKTSS